MKVNQLIIEYIVFCDKRGEVLEFAGFIPLWCAADHQRAEERADDEAKGPQVKVSDLPVF